MQNLSNFYTKYVHIYILWKEIDRLRYFARGPGDIRKLSIKTPNSNINNELYYDFTFIGIKNRDTSAVADKPPNNDERYEQ